MVDFTTLPRNKERTFMFLEELSLSTQAWEMIRLSFRTRVKAGEDGAVLVQFRILPEDISTAQQNLIAAVSDEIMTKLTHTYPSVRFEVMLQVTICCGSDCFGCRIFR